MSPFYDTLPAAVYAAGGLVMPSAALTPIGGWTFPQMDGVHIRLHIRASALDRRMGGVASGRAMATGFPQGRAVSHQPLVGPDITNMTSITRPGHATLHRQKAERPDSPGTGE